jgi:hypothetical protein
LERGEFFLAGSQARQLDFQRSDARAELLDFARRPAGTNKRSDRQNENEDDDAKDQEDDEQFAHT